MTPVTMQKNFFFQSHCLEDGVYLDLLDTDFSDSGSSGEKGDDI